ncbi:MDIS1-interacting receptor like kinase 2-like [Macadamia integrifolia]|uniref:MDIS1-interacting receptor like kinase 2-like n=1 Tax=Macadamia integrifolia TaxID=60698 RepID=UPI001C4ECC50|nr:MDIS1-interacting receptor like kinase 2-like [Macadamia integrifolia]
MPTQMLNLKKLQGLRLGGNKLSGSIPTQIGNLTNLNHLDLSYNEFTGSIPIEIGDLEWLKLLHLAHNNLRGLITVQMEKLDLSSIDLDLSYNDLEGPVPNDIALKTQPESWNNNKVYEYIERGSLAYYVLGNKEEAVELDWRKHIKVIKGVAHALPYLHHDCSPPLIHLDISSNNVLLDANLEPLVADFGTSRFLNPGSSNRTILVGTYGYIAPGTQEVFWFKQTIVYEDGMAQCGYCGKVGHYVQNCGEKIAMDAARTK